AAPHAPIAVSWPVPGLTPSKMLRLDVASGRGWASSLRAQLRRAVIGVRAARASGAVAARAHGAYDSHALEHLLRDAAPRADLRVGAGGQRVRVLCRGAGLASAWPASALRAPGVRRRRAALSPRRQFRANNRRLAFLAFGSPRLLPLARMPGNSRRKRVTCP